MLQSSASVSKFIIGFGVDKSVSSQRCYTSYSNAFDQITWRSSKDDKLEMCMVKCKDFLHICVKVNFHSSVKYLHCCLQKMQTVMTECSNQLLNWSICSTSHVNCNVLFHFSCSAIKPDLWIQIESVLGTSWERNLMCCIKEKTVKFWWRRKSLNWGNKRRGGRRIIIWREKDCLKKRRLQTLNLGMTLCKMFVWNIKLRLR